MGVLRLLGRVIDEEARPVAGASVSVDSVPLRSQLTSSDGAFRFEGLLGRSYQLSARTEDGRATTRQLLLDRETPEVDLLLRAAAAFEVTVLHATERRPLPNATVTVEGQPSLIGTTNAEGKLTLTGLPRGRHVVNASHEGFAPTRVPVFEDRGSGTRPVLLQLSPGSAVFGRVVDSAGRGVAGAVVQAVVPNALSPDTLRAGLAVESDAEGSWRIAALPSGTFWVNAVHPEFGPSSSASFEVGGDGREVGPISVIMGAGAHLTGQVFEASGSPAAWSTVSVRAAGAAARVGVRRSVQADDHGLFTVKGLPRTELWVEARLEGAVAPAVVVDLAEGEADVTLLLETAGVIRGVVVSSRGEPLPGAQVAAVPEDGERRVSLGDSRIGQYAADVSDDLGQFQLSGLLPGHYRVRASTTHAVQTMNFWMGSSVVAETGDTEVQVVVDAMARLHGTVELYDGSPPDVVIVALSLAPPASFRGNGGAFVLEDVPPGNHVVSIASPGLLPHEVELPGVQAGQDLDLGRIILERGFGVSGVVQSADGVPVAGARVNAGPQLTGDGQGPKAVAAGVSTDDAGHFTFPGLEPGVSMVMAEHPDLGRSTPLAVQVGPGMVPLLLELRPAGTLSGIVTRGGKPVYGAAVVAAPGGSSTVRLAVATRADGRFQFDRLSEGPHVLTAGLRLSPTLQLAHRVSVDVGAMTDPVAIDASTGGPEVTLSLSSEDAQGTPLAQMHFVSGDVRASTLAELEALVSAQSPGKSWVALSLQGRPVTLPDVNPGRYSLCTVVIQGKLEDPALQYRVRAHAGASPVSCQPVDVRDAPVQQAVVAWPRAKAEPKAAG